MDAIKILKDVFNIAQKSNDIDMVQKVISAQQSVLEMQEKIQKLNEDNFKLRKQLEKNKEIEYYRNVPIITMKKDSPKIFYCGVCYGKDANLIPLQKISNDDRCYCSCCGMVTYISYSSDSKELLEALK